MSRQSQVNFTSISPDGVVSALFPGGIIMPQDVNNPGPAIPRGKRITWVRDDGTMCTTVGSRRADANPATAFESSFFRQVEDETSVGSAGVQFTRYLATHALKPNRWEVGAGASNPVGVSDGVVIIDNLGNSDFVRSDSGNVHSREYNFTQAVGAIAAGGSFIGGSIITAAPFASFTHASLYGSAFVGGGNNGQFLTYGHTFANAGGFLQVGIILGNPSAVATLALTWRGIVRVEW